MNLIEDITDIDNLYRAWRKVKSIYDFKDAWYDEIEITAFQSNLDYELCEIRKKLLDGTYNVSAIKPILYPKASDNKETKSRQFFWIEVKDQVAWMAVINIIGPILDIQMPAWSYAYRIYMPVFYEKDNGKKIVRYGYYRNSSKITFRKWNQSYLLFKRHIYITSKIMLNYKKNYKKLSNLKKDELDEIDGNILDQNNNICDQYHLKYFDEVYWSDKLKNEVYWITIDLEKFYPSVDTCTIFENYKKFIPTELKSDKLDKLIKKLLCFRVDYSGWSQKELNLINLDISKGIYKAIPTGLFVGGFLANIALMSVDKEVMRKLDEQRNIAHFRFADDHVILSDDFNGLVEWVKWYGNLLNNMVPGIKINSDKIEPKCFADLIKEDNIKYNNEMERDISLFIHAKNMCKMDENNVSPFITKTLTKISIIGHMDSNLLEEDGEKQLISDLEYLLLANIPETEIKKTTRISFAVNKLTQIVSQQDFYDEDTYLYYKQITMLDQRKDEFEKNLQNLQYGSIKALELNEKLKKLHIQINELQRKLSIKLKENAISENSDFRRTFKLIIQATGQSFDKIRLWWRIVQYCRKSGITNSLDIINSVNISLNEGKYSKYTYEFLISFIFNIFSQELVNCYIILKNNKDDDRLRYRTSSFLQGILDDGFLNKILNSINSSKYYYEISLKLFKFTLSSIIFMLYKEKLINNIDDSIYRGMTSKYNMVNWNSIQEEVIDNELFDKMVWWLLVKVNKDSPNGDKSIFYKYITLEKLRKNIEINKYRKAILLANLKELPSELLRKIITTKNRVDLEELSGLVFDAVSKDNFINGKELNYKKDVFMKVSNIVKERREKYISLIEWCQWASKRYDNEQYYLDIRLSEWSCLEIIRQIAWQIQKKVDSDDKSYYKIHPNNFLVSEKWYSEDKQSWDKWLEITDINSIIIRKKDSLINDYRYLPVQLNEIDHEVNESSAIFGLGILLIGLLTRNLELPTCWNIRGLQRFYIDRIKKKLLDISVSSKTLAIIEACFSDRNRETKKLRNIQYKECFYDDTTYDPPEIFKLVDLIKYIKESQNILEFYQISVQDNQPRQLVPISLEQLTRKNNPYEYIEKRGESNDEF